MNKLTIKKITIDALVFIEQSDFDEAVEKYQLTPENVISVVHGNSATVIYYWG